MWVGETVVLMWDDCRGFGIGIGKWDALALALGKTRWEVVLAFFFLIF